MVLTLAYGLKLILNNASTFMYISKSLLFLRFVLTCLFYEDYIIFYLLSRVQFHFRICERKSVSGKSTKSYVTVHGSG